MARPLCLVTGATAGIGAAFARLYAARGHDLALTGRRADRLQQMADEVRRRFGVEVITVPADLAQPGAVGAIVEGVAAQGREIDAVVNNAGYALPGAYASTAWADQQALLQVMVVAVCEMNHRLLPGMIERGHGRIVNVASVAGMIPGRAGAALYGASKALVIKASQAWRQECLGRGVHVTALCPGYTLSEFHDVDGSRASLKALPGWMWLRAEAVAEAGYEAVQANRAVCVPGRQYRALTALARFVPDAWVSRVAVKGGGRLG